MAPGVRTCVTFRELGGQPPEPEAIFAEIRRWPLDAWLGFLGRLTIEMFQADTAAMDPRFQGRYLSRAIVDDFPHRLPDAWKMYAPGRVPITGEKHMLVHEQNIAWLAHAALMMAPENVTTDRLTEGFYIRACRMLLLINDMLGSTRISRPIRAGSTLVERRAAVIDFLRHFQFNRFIGGVVQAMARLVRQRTILLEIVQNRFDIKSCFEEATGGLDLERHFHILATVIVHWAHGLAPGRHWISIKTLTEQLHSNREHLDRTIFGRWTVTPSEYRRRTEEWNGSRPEPVDQPHFDFVVLRETPLIEARPGQAICPVAAFLLAKIEDDVFFVISNHLASDPARRQLFQQTLGLAYEQFASALLSDIARLDAGGGWEVRHKPGAEEGDELCDLYLQRGDVALCFEHKLGRPSTEFLRGGRGDRVVGPNAEILNRLENRESVPYQVGRDADEGYLTKGLWQASYHGPALRTWALRELGSTPAVRFPVFTHLFGPTIEEVSRKGYIAPLITAAGLLAVDQWTHPQWLDAEVLDALLALAEKGRLNLESLFQEKNEAACDKRFDIFVEERLGTRLSDRSREAAIDLLKSTEAELFRSGESG